MPKSNIIYCGDNLEVLRRLPDESVDLIYADPPFFSNRNYEIIWKDGSELEAFKDRWKGGINNYLDWMEERLVECHRVLKPTGSMYLHYDWHASHYLKQVMDRVFGDDPASPKHFLNEIIWEYSTGGISKKYFARKHDNIFFYTKSKYYIFNQLRIETKDKKRFNLTDKDGRKYYEKSGNKYYLDNGVAMTDTWDIYPVRNTSKERLGYPTQKPEALLERIIKASSNEGDIVLDPFCGCGTTLAVAHKLKRRWIGIDVSPIAVTEMKKRLKNLGASTVRIVGMKYTLDEVKALNPYAFQEWACEKLFGESKKNKVGDMGVDGYTKYGIPIQVKQSDNVGRNVVDNFCTAVTMREKKTKGYIVALSFGRGAYEETARLRRENNINIVLLTAEDILSDKHEQYLYEDIW